MEEAKSVLANSQINSLKRPQDELLGAFYDTVLEPKFQDQLQFFFKSNLHLFDNKFLSGKDSEHNLSYTAAYQQYSTLFESHIAEFLSGRSTSESEFLECCQSALSAKTEETEFVEYILATLEYESFLELIRREKIKELMQMVRTLELENSALLKQKASAEAKAEAKDDGGDGAKDGGTGAKGDMAEAKGSAGSAPGSKGEQK
jgi:hypothetical protein